MDIVFKELNQDGILLLHDKFGDDLEITEDGTVDCEQIKINKTLVLSKDRILQNVTLEQLSSLTVDEITIDGDTISNTPADINLIAAKVNLHAVVNIFEVTDFKNHEIKNPSKITIKNGAIIEGNTIQTSAINTSLLVDGNLHGVKIGSEFSSPITWVKFSTCIPKNDIGTNLNCLPMTFKSARMEQIHSCVTIFGNQTINITTANQPTEFKFRMVDAVFIQSADSFYGHGYITNADSGESSHFGAEITKIEPTAEIRFKGFARTAGEHVFTFQIKYTTTNFTNGV